MAPVALKGPTNTPSSTGSMTSSCPAPTSACSTRRIYLPPCSAPASVVECSVSGRSASVDVKRLAGDEGRPFEVEDSTDDIADLADPTKGMSVGQFLVRGGVMKWGLDDAQRIPH